MLLIANYFKISDYSVKDRKKDIKEGRNPCLRVSLQ